MYFHDNSLYIITTVANFLAIMVDILKLIDIVVITEWHLQKKEFGN